MLTSHQTHITNTLYLTQKPFSACTSHRKHLILEAKTDTITRLGARTSHHKTPEQLSLANKPPHTNGRQCRIIFSYKGRGTIVFVQEFDIKRFILSSFYHQDRSVAIATRESPSPRSVSLAVTTNQSSICALATNHAQASIVVLIYWIHHVIDFIHRRDKHAAIAFVVEFRLLSFSQFRAQSAHECIIAFVCMCMCVCMCVCVYNGHTNTPLHPSHYGRCS